MFTQVKTLEERFLEKVQKTDTCWLWLAVKNQDGYGRFRVGCKLQGSHRVSYELYRGNIPENMCVLHACDVRACVNPSHLFLGTQEENIQDMERKGRSIHPTNTRKKVKVTYAMYQDMVLLHSQGLSSITIAKKHNVSSAYVLRLLKTGY